MLRERDKIKLPVVDESPYEYIVEHEGKRYPVKKFLFQRRHGHSRPVKLECYVYSTDPQGKNIVFRQNLAPIFRERYQDKQIYEFTVDSDMTGSERPHYRVTDGSGYWIPLPATPGLSFNKGDRVKLRVYFTHSGSGIFVKLATDYMEASAEPPTLTELSEHLGEAFVHLLAQLREGGLLPQGNDPDKARWDIDAVREARKAVLSVDGEVLDRCYLADDVRAFRDSVTYLLEDTGFMRHMNDSARREMQEELALTASRADDMLRAVELIDADRHELFVQDTLSKIRTSGYLYRPESRLRTLIYIFSLESRLFDTKMRGLIETIQQGDPDNWRSEPFRSAFVEQLQLYIDSKHEQFDTQSDPESNPESTRRLNLLITALAIQQLLLEGGTMSSEFIINRSRLYRYHAFKKHCDRMRMLEKSLQVILSGRVDESEFTWRDTTDQHRLAQSLLHAPEPVDGARIYESCNCTLRVADGRITFSGAGATPGIAALGDIELWHGLQVFLPNPLDPRLRSPHTIGDYKEIWAQIERRIFKPQAPKLPKPAAPKRISRLPSVGEEVKIIIDGAIDDSNYACHVEDFGYKGQGRINIRDISGSRRMLDMSAFDDDAGQPLLFMATVTAVDGDELTFSMLSGVRAFIREWVNEGDVVDAVVMNTPNAQNHMTYTVLTEHGYLVSIEPSEAPSTLTNGNQVKVEITRKSDTDYILKGRVTDSSDSNVQYETAMATLLYSYGAGDDSDDSDTKTTGSDDTDAGQTDDLITDEAAHELMLTIARRADMDTDLVHSYNHFAAARLLARMISGNPEAESNPGGVYEYLDRRCRLLEVLDDFATNGRVDLERLDSFDTSLTAGASNADAVKLRILSYMEKPDSTGSVLDIMQREDNDQVTQLGRLVIAYNAIDGFKLGEEQRRIRESIYRLLNLNVDSQPVQIAGGRESQTVEFKTSAAYPAGGVMRMDKEAQLSELVQVVCGFLNSTGGKLYIGVSDEGYVRGLANDIEAYGDIEKINLALHNAIQKQIGFIPNYASHIFTTYEDYGEKSIIVVNITPLPAPVRCNGVYYERQGTSTEYVPEHKEKQFVRSHTAAKSTAAVRPENNDKADKAPAVTAAAPAPQPARKSPAAPAPDAAAAPAPATEPTAGAIATSQLRHNYIHYDGSEGYHAPALYFFIGADGSYQISEDELWTDEDAALALGLREEEAAGQVMVVYASGHIGRIEVSALVRSRRRMLNTREPAVFISPAAPGAGLIVHYRDEKGVYMKQFYTAEMIPDIKPADQGERLVSGTPVHCELVAPDMIQHFAMLQRNGQRLGRKQSDVDASVADAYSRLK